MKINLPAAQTSPVTQIKQQQGKYAIIYYKQQMTADTEKRTTEKRVAIFHCLLFLTYLSLKNNLAYVWNLQV